MRRVVASLRRLLRSPRNIDALQGVEQHLVREAMVDEVLTLIKEGRVLPVDRRTLGKFTNG
ncbi:MAG TPA: hypothetical protein EYO58_09930 [Flavobacteriales bacterium]|nr:hypothetical protein [Flavobacteriales bacterium]